MSVRIPDFRFLLFFFVFFASTDLIALEVSPNSVEIYAGNSTKLTVSNSSGTVTSVSSNATVANVSYAQGTAIVKGIKAGSSIITVKDKKTSKTVEVTVKAAPSLTVSPTSVTMDAGSTSSIAVSNASGTVTVVSSKTSVVTASYASGKITVKAIAAGSATLTIKDSKTTLTVPVTVKGSVIPTPAAGNFTLLAWNDLGMHCMDGMDFSVYTTLPPYNTLHAQLKDKSGKLITTNVKLTYEAVADSTGSINSYSDTKTNFWDWVMPTFGLNPAPEVGVNLDGLLTGTPALGNKTPSWVPPGSISLDEMTYNADFHWFEAEGIPMSPLPDNPKIDVNGNRIKNFYPTVKVVARDNNDKVLAETITVLPVSDEMSCKDCHASTDSTNPAEIAAKPAAGWVNNANSADAKLDKDWKRNILRLHDEKQFLRDQDPLFKDIYKNALFTKGYDRLGLLATADLKKKPVLCVTCHASNAYFDKQNKKTVMPGMAGIRAFTQVLHLKHAAVRDPSTQKKLDEVGDRTACYQCHPGSKTQCLRGAMGKAVDAKGDSLMSCQSCHGGMTAVGSTNRQGWFNEPPCESCHNNEVSNKRAISVFDANGIVIVPKTDHTFATNANTPVTGLNLYRFSTGHGGLQCEACHGATHAEYPSSHADDNTQSVAVQGHAGTVAECTACHTTVPTTVNGGPHGMHTTGNAWVNSHQDANRNGAPSCTYCHGTTSAGTPLSAIKVAKTINAGEFGTKNWPAGYQVSCYSCHNGPNP